MAIIWLFFLLIATSIVSLIASFIISNGSKGRSKVFFKLFAGFWIFLFFCYLLSAIIGCIYDKKTVDRGDLYGKYVIYKEMFKGKNSDWQYKHFSFEITEDDEFVFYEYFDNGKVKSSHRGDVEFVDSYRSPHLRILNLKPAHQIVEEEPLLVRNTWEFYYVFKSKQFGNVFFIKKEESFFSKILAN